METPPSLPAPPPGRRLGRAFYLTMVAPVVVIAVTFGLAHLARDKDGGAAVAASSLAMFGCSVACAIMVGRAGAGVVTFGRVVLSLVIFLGLQALYITCLLFGCTAALGSPNFH